MLLECGVAVDALAGVGRVVAAANTRKKKQTDNDERETDDAGRLKKRYGEYMVGAGTTPRCVQTGDLVVTGGSDAGCEPMDVDGDAPTIGIRCLSVSGVDRSGGTSNGLGVNGQGGEQSKGDADGGQSSNFSITGG